MMAGTKKHDRQALREELDALGVVISPGLGGFGGGRGGRGGGGGGGALGQLTFSVQAKRDTLPKALTLLGEILREPAFPEAEFETRKRGLKAGLAASTTDPSTLAGNRLSRALSPYGTDDVRYVPTLEESLERANTVTLDQVRTLYQTQIGATRGELAVVGDFDADLTLSKVKEILSGWESKVPVRRIERKPPPDRAGAKESILTPDKANAVFLAGLAFPLKESDPDFAAIRLGNFILGGSTLSSRLGDRIRQKEGLSYGATSSFSAGTQDPVATLTINAITNPANIDKVDVAAAEEVDRFLKEGPSLGELADAKNALLEAQKVGRTTDSAIAGQIVSHLHLGRTFAYEAEQEKRIQALTPDDVKAAFKKHVDPKKLVIIRAGDFKK
jgi:zinc protease